MSSAQDLRNIKNSITEDELKKAKVLLWLKSLFLLSGFIVTYFYSLSFQGSFIANILIMILSAVFAGGILLNIVHEAVHYTYSKKKWVNSLWGLSLTLLGSSSLMWRERHVSSHHNHTNIINEDIDIPRTDQNLLRVSVDQPRKWYHRYQSLYSIYLYLSFPMYSFLFEEVNSFVKNKLKIKSSRLRKKIFLEIVIAKLVYAYLYLYLPITIFGWINGLIFNYIFNWVISASSILPLMVGHISKDVAFVSMKNKPDWIRHQVESTVNFSLKNRLMTWYTGGNNYHIEHHLFPNMNHLHYPSISHQVKILCDKKELVYKEYPSFLAAFKNHVLKYKELGDM